MNVSEEFTYEFVKTYVKQKKNPHRIYSAGFHYLVGTLQKKWHKRSQLYEMCITISPKSEYYDEDPEEQYKALRSFIREESSKRNIDHITAYEFSKKGALHTHMLLRSSTGYQRPLQLLRNMAQRKFGRTSLSEVNNFLNYFTYMVKGLGKEGFELDVRQMKSNNTKEELLKQKMKDNYALYNDKLLSEIRAMELRERYNQDEYHIPDNIYGKLYKYIDAQPRDHDLLRREKKELKHKQDVKNKIYKGEATVTDLVTLGSK